ncbi:MAG: hypothetical protein FWF70_03455 [Bacteroidetes bacterium]|nr:hypothetical protein [Bacteroidota bacterium]MCL1968604.1 hypothetical protein [Bacteroidota bacterium]
MRTKLLFILVIILLGGRVYTQIEKTNLSITEGLNDAKLKAKIEENVSLLLTAMGKAMMEGEFPNLSNINISLDASIKVLSLWKTSVMICPVTNVERKCLTRPQGGYQIRDIPVTMLDAPEEEQAQDIVINFTDDGNIDDILVAVHALTDFLDPNFSVQEYARREIIAGFVEEFRTAYNTKDIECLEKVFSNNALIITGKVIKERPNSDQVLKNNLSTERIEYVTQTKEQYLKKLRIIFNAIKYINVVFNDIEIMKHPKYPEIYGVTLKQYWNTSSYSDEGFLFLLIDFTEADPVIHIRAWQPSVFNGKELSREERFRPTSFGNITGK